MPAPTGVLTTLTGAEIADRVRAGELRAIDVAEETLRRIDAIDGEVRAFLATAREDFLDQARAVEFGVRAWLNQSHHALLSP